MHMGNQQGTSLGEEHQAYQELLLLLVLLVACHMEALHLVGGRDQGRVQVQLLLVLLVGGSTPGAWLQGVVQHLGGTQGGMHLEGVACQGCNQGVLLL